MLAAWVLSAWVWCLVLRQHVALGQHLRPDTLPPSVTTTTHGPHSVPSSGVEANSNSSSPHMTTPPAAQPEPRFAASRMCEPAGINVTGPPGGPVLEYLVQVPHPEACEDDIIKLLDCEGTERVPIASWLFEVGGKLCVGDPKHTSYKLSLKGINSSCFSLRGIELSHDDPVFRDDSMEVKFLQLPHWAKKWHIQIVSWETGLLAGELSTTRVTQDLFTVPGNYTRGKDYNLAYWYEYPEKVLGTCSDWILRNRVHYSNKIIEPRDSSLSGNILVVIILVVVIGVVAISALLYFNTSWCHHVRGKPNPPPCVDVPLLSPTAAAAAATTGDVLLVYAQDGPCQTQHCQNLKEAITRCCGRNVQDITLSDPKRLEFPQRWVSGVMSRKENSILVIVSPVLAALDRCIQQGRNAVACSEAVVQARGRAHHFDGLLFTCLKYLQEHLGHNYQRLFVVRFREEDTKDDIPALVPDTRYLLSNSHHCQELFKALGGCWESGPLVPSSEQPQHSDNSRD